MTSNKPQRAPRRVPTIFKDAARNPGFAAGAFGLSAWAYVGMSHTIADYEGPELGYGLGIAYEALVIGMAWEGRRRADQALDAGRAIKGHHRWLVGAIGVGILSGALAAWHGWSQDEGVFALSRAVAPILAAVAVHLFFQSAASARDLERKARIQEEEAQARKDQEAAVLDMLDAVRHAKIAPPGDHASHISAVNDAVTRVHRNVPAGVTEKVTGPHLESERVIHNVIREAADLAGAWMPEPETAATQAELPVDHDDMTHDTDPAAGDVTNRPVVTHEEDTNSSVLARQDTPVRVAAADDTPTRVTTHTRVSTHVGDTTSGDVARSAWPRFAPASARPTTPPEAVTQPRDVIDGEGDLFEPLPDTATPEERGERARALASHLGTADENGGLRITTAVADQIAVIVGRKRRQVYRYLEGENLDSTDTGPVPVVPVAALDFDDTQLDDDTADYAAAAMVANR
jgi:hypothetical protein